MKKKRLLALIGSVCLAVMLAVPLVAGCAAPAPTPTPTPAEWEWPETLVINGCSIGSGQFSLVSAIAPVLEEETGMKVRVTPGDPVPAYNDCLAGDLPLAVEGGLEYYLISMGKSGAAVYPKGQLRIVFYLMGIPFGFFTTQDNELQTIYDLKKGGFSVAELTADPGSVALWREALPGFLGLTPEEADDLIEYVPVATWDAQMKATVEGVADMTFGEFSSGTAYEVEASPRGMRMIDTPFDDKEGWKRFLRGWPGSVPMKSTYGVQAAIGSEGFGVHYFEMARADFDEDLAYHLIKWLDENYALYKDKQENLSMTTMENFRGMLDTSFVPVHKGTIRYLREIGMWTSEDDEWNETAIVWEAKCIEAWDDAAAEARARGITMAEDNQEWLDLYETYKVDIPPVLIRLPD